MKKSIVLTCVLLMFGLAAMAQSATTATKTTKTKTCKSIAPEECAAKMGLTLEEYLSLPKKDCKKTASASGTSEASGSTAMLVTDKVANSEKKCCSSMEECAKKMGMTVEQCKALCPSSSLTKVATKEKTDSEKSLVAQKEK